MKSSRQVALFLRRIWCRWTVSGVCSWPELYQVGTFKFERQLMVWTSGARAGCDRHFPAHWLVLLVAAKIYQLHLFDTETEKKQRDLKNYKNQTGGEWSIEKDLVCEMDIILQGPHILAHGGERKCEESLLLLPAVCIIHCLHGCYNKPTSN